jgi:predicted transcriptional regulator
MTEYYQTYDNDNSYYDNNNYYDDSYDSYDIDIEITKELNQSFHELNTEIESLNEIYGMLAQNITEQGEKLDKGSENIENASEDIAIATDTTESTYKEKYRSIKNILVRDVVIFVAGGAIGVSAFLLGPITGAVGMAASLSLSSVAAYGNHQLSK